MESELFHKFVEPTVTTKRFQWQGKKFHLTYKTHIPFLELLNLVKSKVGELKWYSVVHEVGSDNTMLPYPHTHLAFETAMKVTNSSPAMLDYLDVHPNVKRIQTKDHVKMIWQYHQKAPVLREVSSFCPVQEVNWIRNLVNAESLEKAFEMSGLELRSIQDLRALRMDRNCIQEIPVLLSRCSSTLEAPANFHAIFLTGVTGTGKTRWALDQFASPLLVSHLEDLKSYRPDQHDGIVFDDMCFRDLKAQAAIHLTDWDMPRTINVKHGSVTLPANTRKIFTSNESLESVFPISCKETLDAIRRRIRVIHVKGPLFSSTSQEILPNPNYNCLHLDSNQSNQQATGLGTMDLDQFEFNPELLDPVEEAIWSGTFRASASATASKVAGPFKCRT